MIIIICAKHFNYEKYYNLFKITVIDITVYIHMPAHNKTSTRFSNFKVIVGGTILLMKSCMTFFTKK